MMRATLFLILVATCLPASAWAQDDQGYDGRTWSEEKCVRYERAWNDVMKHRGNAGISAEFTDANAGFIAGGCTGERNVCPRSAGEFEVADLLSIAGLNAGITGSFMPFACRD